MESIAFAVLVYSVQILVIVGAAAAAAACFRLPNPTASLVYWRAVAAVCLALPLLPSAPSEPSATGLTFGAAVLGGQGVAPIERLTSTSGSLVVWIWAAGAAARLVWLLAGACRLRQMRRRSTIAAVSPDLDAVRLAGAPHAELRWSADVDQPVTFGARRPVILLPRHFAELSAEVQHAVLHHEALHVARRDWIWIVVEEHVRAVFWFHPAVWWLLEQLQLAREQAIDALVAARTGSKRAYMTALVAFADAGGRTAAPALAFLRKRHLKSRLRQLSKESHMTRKHLAFTTAALVVAMSGATWGVVRALPLGGPEAAAQDEKRPENGVSLPKVIYEEKPQYTPEAMRAKIDGEVVLEAVVLETGRVGEVEVTKSLDTTYGLDEEAVKALKQWRFEPGRRDGKPVSVLVTVWMTFTLRD